MVTLFNYHLNSILKWLYFLTIILPMYEDSNYSTFLTILVIICHFYVSYHRKYVPRIKSILILTSLKNTDAEYPLMCLFAFLIPFLEKYLFKSFAHILIRLLFDFLNLNCKCYSCILNVNTLS